MLWSAEIKNELIEPLPIFEIPFNFHFSFNPIMPEKGGGEGGKNAR